MWYAKFSYGPSEEIRSRSSRQLRYQRNRIIWFFRIVRVSKFSHLLLLQPLLLVLVLVLLLLAEVDPFFGSLPLTVLFFESPPSIRSAIIKSRSYLNFSNIIYRWIVLYDMYKLKANMPFIYTYTTTAVTNYYVRKYVCMYTLMRGAPIGYQFE